MGSRSPRPRCGTPHPASRPASRQRRNAKRHRAVGNPEGDLGRQQHELSLVSEGDLLRARLLGRGGGDLRRRARPRAAQLAGARRLAQPADRAHPADTVPDRRPRLRDRLPGAAAGRGGSLGRRHRHLSGDGPAGEREGRDLPRRPGFVVGDARPAVRPGVYEVVLCRHVLWALPDRAAALARWADLLTPSGRILLIEGDWSTGVGLTGEQTVALVEGAGLTASLRPLSDPGTGASGSTTSATSWSASACRSSGRAARTGSSRTTGSACTRSTRRA